MANDVFKIDFPKDLSQVHFIKLFLKNKEGKIISDAFYWRSKDSYDGAWTMTGPAISGFQKIDQLAQAELDITIEQEKNSIKVKVRNISNSLSFFTQLKLQDQTGKSISPTFYSDNFFNLLPDESKTIVLTLPDEKLPSTPVLLKVEAYNTVLKTYKIEM